MNLQMIWEWGKKGLAVVGLFIVLFFVMGFNTRMTQLNELEVQHAIESTDIYQLRLTESYLQTEITYATSEPAVEEWAREYGVMRETRDQVIFLQPDPNFTPMPEIILSSNPETLSNWEIWVLWFFGPE